MAIGIVHYFTCSWEGNTGHALYLVGPLSGSPTAIHGPAQLTPGLTCRLSLMQSMALKMSWAAFKEDHLRLICSANLEPWFAQHYLCHVTYHDK